MPVRMPEFTAGGTLRIFTHDERVVQMPKSRNAEPSAPPFPEPNIAASPSLLAGLQHSARLTFRAPIDTLQSVPMRE